MKSRNIFSASSLCLIFFLVAGCNFFEDPEVAGNIVFTDPSQVVILAEESTVTLLDENTETPTTIAAGSFHTGIKKASDFTYTLKYVAKAEAVVVDGVTTQANDLTISGNNAYIAYNAAGADFKGAIQILDITNKKRPSVIREIHFSSMDINAILADGSNLIFGGAANPDILGYRSFIGSINLSNPKINEIETSIQPLTSYALTDIAAHGGYYYASVGALDGGIHIVDSSLNLLEFIPRGDIRGMDNYQDGVIALAGATDTDETSAEMLFLSGRTLSGSVAIDDFASPYAKATIVSKGSNIAFTGLSEAGMRIFDLSDIEFESPAHLNPIAIHANPEVIVEGLNPATNSVSYERNLLFSANGEWGVRVFDLPTITELSSTNTTTLLGYFPLEGIEEAGQNYSANHVEYKAQYLMVAVGIGGVYFIHLE
jgi:hypothetical protein